MRIRHIAGGLAAVMAAAFSMPAAARAATGPVPPVSYGPNPPASVNASATPGSPTTQYAIHNFRLGCIADPGHGNLVYVRFTCNTTFNFIDPVTTDGYTWYLLRFSSTSDCLNYDPHDGFVYDDSCIPNDPNEMWEHHVANWLGNKAGYNMLGRNLALLSTCNYSANARLILVAFVPFNLPTGCHNSSSVQHSWVIEP